jgi:hypothetical protein
VSRLVFLMFGQFWGWVLGVLDGCWHIHLVRDGSGVLGHLAFGVCVSDRLLTGLGRCVARVVSGAPLFFGA